MLWDEVYHRAPNRTASKLTPKPLFVLYGGDAVRSGSVAQLTYFRDTTVNFVKKNKLPFFMVPGNHERNGVGGPLTDYQNIIGPRKGNQAVSENQLNYLLNTRNLRMIMLNDVGPVSGGKTYGITPSALATFEQGVRTNKRVLVVMHVPPKTGSFRNFSSSDAFPVTTAADKKFIADLRTAKNVKLVLVSHIHDKLLKGQIAGKTAVLNGNGGAGLDTRPTPHPAIASFTFLRSTNSIRFNGQKAVKVNRNLRPNKVFITTQGGTITVPIP